MHDLKNRSTETLTVRLLEVLDGFAPRCGCSENEFDDGYQVGHCDWNDVEALEAELARREIAGLR